MDASEIRVTLPEFGTKSDDYVSGFEAGSLSVIDAMRATESSARETFARLVERFPDDILVMVPRPGGPPGNFYRKTTKQDIADAIRNLNSEAK